MGPLPITSGVIPFPIGFIEGRRCDLGSPILTGGYMSCPPCGIPSEGPKAVCIIWGIPMNPLLDPIVFQNPPNTL